MAAKSLILIETNPQKTYQVNAGLRRSLEPRPVFSITGRYDILVVNESESPKELSDVVTQKVRPTEGITGTTTLFVLEESKDEKRFEAKSPVTAFSLVRAEPEKIERLFEKLPKEPQVQWAAVTTGEYDLALFLAAGSIEELKRGIFSVAKQDGIRQLETFVATR